MALPLIAAIDFLLPKITYQCLICLPVMVQLTVVIKMVLKVIAVDVLTGMNMEFLFLLLPSLKDAKMLIKTGSKEFSQLSNG